MRTNPFRPKYWQCFDIFAVVMPSGRSEYRTQRIDRGKRLHLAAEKNQLERSTGTQEIEAHVNIEHYCGAKARDSRPCA
jgi:hypothetical protein